MGSPAFKVLTIGLTWGTLLCGCSSDAAPFDDRLAVQTPTAEHYHATFSAVFTAAEATAQVTIKLEQGESIVKTLDFKAPAAKYMLLSGDGQTSASNDRIIWSPPEHGGSLHYTFAIDSQRGSAYDARHQQRWVILRLGDLFPPANARTRKGAQNTSILILKGPTGWSFESRYGGVKGMAETLPATDRNFTRPTGWMLGGKLGTRRDTINGRKIVVSAPLASGVRRLDTLSFLRWTLPELTRVFPNLPERLLIAGAPQQMWRGGLSAPDSLYLHADRPLISENGTSTLLHELIHLSGVHSAAQHADWIVEGLAEYYSLLILKRSGGTSEERFNATISSLQDWVTKDKGVLTDPSKGANTAAAVLTLHALAAELHAAGSHIDQLTTRLLTGKEISVEILRDEAATLLGYPSRVLGEPG